MPPKFVPRERKHRRLAKLKETSKKAPPTQSNEEVIVPISKSDQDERRQQIKDELRAHQPDVKISGKKRKRLDHYVDTKLRKEENLELIKKLASHQIDTTLLQSSKKLGRVKDTRREVIERALRERHAGIDVRGDQAEVLFQRREEPTRAHIPAAVPTEIISSTATESFGSGLKRPLDVGDDGKPLLPSRKRRKREKKARSSQEVIPVSDKESEDTDDEAMDSESDQDEWNGFSDGEVEDHSTEGSREDTASGSEDDSATSNSLDEDSDGENEESEADKVDKPARASAFKMWAAARRNEAIGFEPSIAPTSDPAVIAAFKPRASSPDPAQPAASATAMTARPEKAVTIDRATDIQAARLELPVLQEEQKIMEAIHNNPITIICGETGSGKTTQVPQMMYEAGYGSEIEKPMTTSGKSTASLSKGMIGVTQPRRVAAVSVAQRVKTEMGSEFSRHVAHQVRYDSAVTKDTSMKFMTDGILLREISQDFVLSKYSAIVIDEAHERSVNTDILIGMLSRIVPLRAQLAREQPIRCSPLKLVIMSATLRVSDFIQNDRLFKGVVPPIVEAEGRQHPVTVHFSRTTERDFVSEMVRKLERAHRKLPHGGMLVFLTGQQEIQDVAARLNQVLGGNASYSRPTTNGRNSSFGFGADDYDDATIRKRGDTLEGVDEAGSDVEINGADSDAEDADFDVALDPAFVLKKTQGLLKPHILPLYAALPTSQQMRVFQDPPAGHRLIVLATNVAETSLTIPGIRYVFDCGRSKEKVYDTSAGPGIQTFEIDWISKASAAQRTGRAGRTGPGHCYRLYSSAVFEEFFAEHAVPEILRTPLENVVLQLKSMEIENVVNFPFPTPPERKQLEVAETLLWNLGAIEENSGKITPLGRQLLAFPVSPRFGKILLLAQANEVVTPAVATVAALAVGDLSIPEVQAGAASAHVGVHDESDDYDGNQRRRVEREGHTAAELLHQKYTRAQAKLSRWDERSDAVKMLATVAVHADAMLRKNSPQICKDFYLHEKPLQEA
ncbi:putative ATP-dependent RNA helicase DHR1 [Oleoguttula sp. CCFEE 5521]